MTSTAKDQRKLGPFVRGLRACSIGVASAVLATVVAGIPLVPGLPGPPAAHAASGTGRICSGVQASGTWTASFQRVIYKLFVPNGATMTIQGSIDVITTNLSRSNLYINTSLGQIWFFPGAFPGTTVAVSGTETNGGASRDIVVDVNQAYTTLGAFRFTITVSGGAAPTGPCTPMSPEETTGRNCSEPNAATVQGLAADPVNTATGNFNQAFDDFSIPGRGPGLVLDHAYNSLLAGVDGPLGFGWTHSYAVSLTVDAGSGVAAVSQESGAQVKLYPDGAGGFEAPPRAVATLVRNGDGSYTFLRCNRTTMAFSPTGQLASITDRNGYATTLQYVDAKLATVTDTAGRKLTFGWTGNRLTSVSDGSTPPRTVTFGYDDGAGNLTDYTDVAGGSWRFTYDGSHRLETMRRPRQASVPNPPVTRNVYDPTGRVTAQTDELGRTTSFDYTSIPGSTKVTDPSGNATVEAYQNLVRTSLTRGYGGAAPSTWTFETDGTLGVTRVIDPLGRSTVASYDSRGNLLTVRDPLNNTSWATYDDFDQPLTTTDASGVTTTYAYDPNGNVTAVSTPLKNAGGGTVATRQVLYGYDPARPGELTSVTDPTAKVWTRSYDAFGNRDSETDPLGNRALYGYDPATGWLTSQVSPRGAAAGVTASCTPPALGCTTFARDAWGRVTTTTDPNGDRSVDAYDSDGNLDTQVDGTVNLTDFRYDAADQQVSVRRADTTTLRTSYWADGSVKATRDGANQAMFYRYDTQGRLTSSTDPNGRTTSYGYDPAGNLVTKADPAGACPAWPIAYPPALAPSAGCTVYGYDAADRLTSVTYSDPATPDVTSVGYDKVGRRTAMVDGTGSSSWTWDSLGRLTSATGGAGRRLSYTYANLRDPATGIDYPPSPTARTVTRGFDDAGRMTSVADWLGNVTTFSPDANSNITKATPPAATGLADDYGFDDADRLANVTHKAGPSTLAAFTYGRDDNGQVASVSSSGVVDTRSYTYTPLNQIEGVDASSYDYDAADNLTATASGETLAYDPAKQLTTLTRATNATTFGYDTRGNRSAAIPAVGVGTRYSYDQANRLTAVDDTSFSDDLAGGWYHSLAVKADGTVSAWGDNDSGQLGNNTTTDSLTPIQVAGMSGVVAVSAGAYHSLALKADGTVWAWGSNGYGQLGDDTTTDSLVPVRVKDLSGVTAIASGSGHSLALKADGTVWAWGLNGSGQLGNDTLTNARAPVQVNGLTATTAIAAGYAHSLAVRTDGTVWAWGSNGFGELGNDTLSGARVPTQVPGLRGVSAIDAGWFHSLATAGDGTVWAWGFNRFGQLGNGSTTDSRVPLQVPALTGVTEVVAGGYHSFARRSDASVAAWGYNANGQLGVGSTANASTPQTVAALAGATGLATGPSHALALRPDASASSWGYNVYGQLGNGTTAQSTSPVAVSSFNQGAAPTATYTYDGDGLRRTKTVAGTRTDFTWDASGGLPLLVDDGTNSYLYGPDGLPISQIGPGNVVTWYHHDQLGSTRTLTSSTGAVVGRATYDPYGRLTASVGTLSPLGFAGEYTDAETGFQYLRARYYDPATGQFLTRDPIEALTREAYGYVGGNPLNYTDPLGLYWGEGVVEKVGKGAAAVGGFVGDHIGEIGTAVGCGLGLATAETGVGLLLAGATCTTAIGLDVLGSRTDSNGPGRVGVAYGCGVGLAVGLKNRNPIELVAAAQGCVFGAGIQAASERERQNDPKVDCDMPRKK